MDYSVPHILSLRTWNNAFAWEERIRTYGKTPTLTIPSLIDGTIDDALHGDTIVFEEMEDGKLRSCTWLKNFVRIEWTSCWNHRSTTPPITIFDNHNHALYFWLDALRQGIIKSWFELIHIDEHSDLWDNEYELDLDMAREDEEYAWDFTNYSCNVGNYIRPALRSGLIGDMIRIENEFQIDQYMSYEPSRNSVLNLDLDIFAPDLDHIPEEKKIRLIRHLLERVKYVTIATSPYFIEQWKALQMLKKLVIA